MLERKMDMARNLLMKGQQPAAVSAHLGYHELSSFSNAFKKHFGSSPKVFQTQLGL